VPPSTVVKIGRMARRKKVGVLDAPVSGGRPGAELGTLTIMVGGDKATFERCLEVLKAIGKNIYHVGGLGSGETIKLINAMMGNANLFAAREALELASKAKIDLKLLQSIVSSSTGQSWTWDNLVPRILDSKNVGVRLDVLVKDVSYAIELAKEVGSDANISREVLTALSRLRKSKGGSVDISVTFPSIKGQGNAEKV
jgi:3-hydroxyisobutyrate dehydrogenase-like beta-hydroxyacid dehydrogenase